MVTAWTKGAEPNTAHGHPATMITRNRLKSFCTTATSAATTTTPGVYHSANLPTTSCVRETVSFAFWTASWMRDWKLALTSASAVTNKNPECNKEPPRTFEPLSLSTGLASPVTWLSSTEPSPLTTVPSAGIASPFRTWNCMPTLSSDALIIRSSARYTFTEGTDMQPFSRLSIKAIVEAVTMSSKATMTPTMAASNISACNKEPSMATDMSNSTFDCRRSIARNALWNRL
mmetsp:Transcript_114382/g.296217  ORF Transcript_114382/g.296217 Transcript_114382/m.296217 type:complete len:231 (-) Transcript_114382:393-1085(-)